jgi:Flp pilus assembly protein TadG
MRIRFNALVRRDEGQALVELSLCAGFLCLLLLAVWQIGAVFSNYIDVSEAARAGARAAALSGAPTTTGDAPSLTAAIEEGKFAAINSVGCTYAIPAVACTSVPGMDVTIDKVGTWTAGGQVKATVTAPYKLTLFGVVNVSSGMLTASDIMRVHRQGA